MQDEPGGATAILRFRHSAAGSGVSRRGPIRPGGRLVIEYDLARFPPSVEPSGTTTDVICHARFLPGGEHHTGSVLDRAAAVSQAGTPRHVPFEMPVPLEATRVELWFESRGAAGSLGWDSRYGQNYAFPVVSEGLPVPEPAVALRPEAQVDPSRIQVVEDAANKETTVVGAAGKRLHTELVIRALVTDSSVTDVWADIHVFDAADELVQTGTVPLQRGDSNANGLVFVWEDDVYQGSGGGSGMGVWSRPDAHAVQYRLYSQIQTAPTEARPRLFTDGILHEFEVPSDEDVTMG